MVDTICLVDADTISLKDADTIYLTCPATADPTPFLTSHRLNGTRDYALTATSSHHVDGRRDRDIDATTSHHLDGRRSYRRRP